MARKKAASKAKPKKDTGSKTFSTITFHGGPRSGETMNMSLNPPPYIRLAFPEWCNYFRRDGTFDYDYDMERAPIRHPHDFRNLDKDKT